MTDVRVQDHHWVVAANVPVDTRAARRADRRGNFRVSTEVKIEALEVYCDGCRRPFNEVSSEKCHITPLLHGGPVGTRKRRGPQSADTEDDAYAATG